MKPKLRRIIIGIPEPQLAKLDQLIEQGIYPGRNEAVRDGIRGLIKQYETATPCPA